jgi:protein-tyrosine phosphatase
MHGRRIDLQGAFNFRDLGGLGAGEALVTTARVYRSDALHRLTPRDLAVLEPLGIGRVFDLRSPAEVARDGIGEFAAGRHVHVPLVEQTLNPFDPAIDWAQIDLRERYLEMLAVGGAAIRTVLEAAADDAGAIVFHCTGGKDRTGVVAAVLLRALGVDDDAIVEDYALSERYLRSALDAHRRDLLAKRFAPDVVAYLTSSPPERMRVMLRELDRRWGSTGAYLASIGAGEELIARLKACLLR